MRLWSSGYDRGFPTAFYYERREIASNPGSNPGSRIFSHYAKTSRFNKYIRYFTSMV